MADARATARRLARRWERDSARASSTASRAVIERSIATDRSIDQRLDGTKERSLERRRDGGTKGTNARSSSVARAVKMSTREGVDVEATPTMVGTLCEGGGHPVAKTLAAPFVLTYRATRAYVQPCVGAYAGSLARAVSERLCCCFAGMWRYEDKKWCGNAAIGDDPEHRDCDWVRVEELSAGSDEKPMVLYQGTIEPRDCVQGALGNCWLVSALACLAEHPGAVKRIILQNEKTIRGKYQVRFYDGKEKRFVIVTVDDLIPCKKGTKKPIYMQPHENEFWPLIVEKAMAKFMGSYSALDGGHGTWATHALTGDHVFMLKKRQGATSRYWRRHNMKFIGKPGDGRKKDAVFHKEVEEDIVRDKLFNILEQYNKIDSLIAVARVGKNGESKDENNGLVEGHLFSVMSVRWAGRSFGVGGRRMVKIRNPWSSYEWKGPWGDGTKEWDKHPSIAKELGYENKNDGIFWMDFDDFVEYFNQISVCDRTTKNDLMLHYDQDFPCTGPIKGCLGGCFCFWIGCRGPRTIYCGHESTDELREARACGCVKVGNT